MFNILAYPPTEEQVKIMGWVGLYGENWLIVLRVVATLLLAFSLFLLAKTIAARTSRIVALVTVCLLIISPTLWVVALAYPLTALMLFCLSLVLNLNYRFFYIGVIVLPILNVLLIGNHPTVLSKIGFEEIQEKVNNHFYAEDSLREKIETPLWFRRLSGNKIFFDYKEIVTETLPFFDLESLFFGEINPTEQKSIVMFYWTEIFLLVLGLYYLTKQKNKEINHFLLISGLIVWLGFVFSSGPTNLRLIGAMWPISLILATGLVNISKYIAIPLSLLIVYGILINASNLSRRSEYWFDNRPLVYQFWFENIDKLDLSKYKTIRVSGRVGNGKGYCFYYLGEKCKKYNFIFESFEVPKDEIEKNTLLAGFVGEFAGSREDNRFPNNWVDKVQETGIKILAKSSVRDSVAFRFGEDIGLAEIE
ncbi:MAG: hypothetical protein WCV93_02215 [Candidatus Shapirobacteria bacterium]|jgi:hypothetical protein